MDAPHNFPLTEYAHAAGCGCKIAPAVLQEMLKASETEALSYPNLIAGNEGFEDAALLELPDGKVLISTTDFFSPIVDDAFDFGRIAAANAISDVYAMGGKPILALGILGWPVEKIPPSLAGKVMQGAKSICKKAGIPLAGGHSIDAPEPFFGLSVNGLAEKKSIKRNNTIKEGDILLLTKPIGVGILSTALKRKLLEEKDYSILLDCITQLNSIGEQMGEIETVHALTDVTGFGLLGHLIEMVGEANFSIELHYNKIPVIEGAKKYLAQRIVPDATYRNWNHYHQDVSFENNVNIMEAFNLLPDPQTNGGLLIAADPASLEKLKIIFSDFGLILSDCQIGKVINRTGKKIHVCLAE
jgi:selenide,water dikinase